jgi:hypothetical protein
MTTLALAKELRLVDVNGGAGRARSLNDRGRDTHYWVPPAQNRTGGIPAYGSHLGCLTAKRSRGHG